MSRLRVRTKLLLVVLVINVLATTISTAHFYAAQRRDLLQGIDSGLVLTAYGAMRIVDQSYHDRIEGPQSIPEREYLQVVGRLSEFAAQTSARWVYSYMESGDGLVYASCSASAEELRDGSYAHLFEKYETPSPALLATMADGRTRWAEYNDPTGIYHSVFVRRSTSSGRPYVVGVDVPAGFVQDRLRVTALRSLEFGLGCLLATGFGLWVMVSRVVRPLRALTTHTDRLAQAGFRWDEEARRQMAAISAGTRDEVGRLAHVLTGMERKLRDYIVTLTETTAAQERMQSELAIARDIQMGLLPPLTPEVTTRRDLALHAVMIPAKEVGGDLYDVFMLDDERLFFLIGDVSDKGVPAALFMAVTMTLFKAHASDPHLTIDGVVSRVNRDLTSGNPWQLFVTALAGILETRSGRITYCDAGHLPPFLLRADGGVEEVEKRAGLALACDGEYRYRCGTVTLGRGDSIIAYTDGVTEAMDEGQHQLGCTGLREALEACGATAGPERLTEALVARVRAHSGSAPQSDDIAILAIQYRGPAAG